MDVNLLLASCSILFDTCFDSKTHTHVLTQIILLGFLPQKKSCYCTTVYTKKWDMRAESESSLNNTIPSGGDHFCRLIDSTRKYFKSRRKTNKNGTTTKFSLKEKIFVTKQKSWNLLQPFFLV